MYLFSDDTTTTIYNNNNRKRFGTVTIEFDHFPFCSNLIISIILLIAYFIVTKTMFTAFTLIL